MAKHVPKKNILFIELVKK